MAELNVFELTTQELRNMREDASKKASKGIKKESVMKKRSKKRTFASIPVNRIKVESIQMFREADEDEVEIETDYNPDSDDVVLVVDPEVEEVPEDLDQAEEQAEDLIGSHVCKCSICGANYVTDEEITEDMEMEDEECPVCGETGEQIVVGVITPSEELSADDEEDITGVEVEDEIEDEGDGEEVDVDEFEEEEDDDFEESVQRSRARTMRRRRVESAKRPVRTLARKPSRKTAPVQEDISFDEVTFNRMLTTFAKENYSNVKSVRISKGTVRGSRLTLEGVVTTTKGSKRPIKFVAENFKPSKTMSIRFREIGPFTESIKGQKVTFIVECVMRGKQIVPAALKYNFKAKNATSSKLESRSTYSVTGRVLSESVRGNRRPKRPTRNKK